MATAGGTGDHSFLKTPGTLMTSWELDRLVASLPKAPCNIPSLSLSLSLVCVCVFTEGGRTLLCSETPPRPVFGE